MKVAAARALADLAKKEIPTYLEEIHDRKLTYGKEYIIPSPFDKRLVVEVSAAVAQAAVQTGSSAMEDFDINAYKKELSKNLASNG